MKKLTTILLIALGLSASAQTPNYNISFNTRIRWLSLDNSPALTPDSLYGKKNGNIWMTRIGVTDLFNLQGKANWDMAYGWGNHTGLYRAINWVPAISDIPNLQTQLNGKLTAETDPNVPAWVKAIIQSDIARWNAPPWGDITGKPSTFTPSTHTHVWTDITGKPSTFTPAAHNHVVGDISGLQTTLDAKLTENQIINVVGDATGSGKTSINLTLATVVTPGTYTKLTVDAKGRVTTGTQATKSDVGLPNVDNTSDANKPISIAAQTALNGKQNIRKEYFALVTPTVANGFVIDYSSAGFTAEPVVQITPQTTTTSLLSLPLVIIGAKTNTQCTVYIINSGNTTVSLLGAIVQGLTFATNLTGVKLNVWAVQP